MKLGRNRPKVWKPTLDFERYLTGRISDYIVRPAHEFEVIEWDQAHFLAERSVLFPKPARPLGQRWESKSIHLLHDPAGNDDVGDCTCAGMLKLDVGWRDNAGPYIGDSFDMKSAALGLYERACGYNPSDPSTDQGGELTQVLDYVKANGVYADGTGKIAGYVAVDATKPDQIAKAIDIFGGVYTGAEILNAWMQSPVEGDVWDICSDESIAGGHCVAWFDYNEQGVIFNTWGLFMTLTWAAAAKYWGKSAGGEVYAVFSPDWLNSATQTSPSGFNAAQLAADLSAFGG